MMALVDFSLHQQVCQHCKDEIQLLNDFLLERAKYKKNNYILTSNDLTL